MARTTRCLALAVALAIPAVLSAQVTVASTFGPSDQYDSNSWWFIHASQSIAQGFSYTGGEAYLSSIRVGMEANQTPYKISFGVGSTMNSVTLLESWTILSNGTISTLVSSLMPLLTGGNNYWVWATSPTEDYYSGWNFNNQGYRGLSATFTDGYWYEYPDNLSSAFDVSVNPVPEPASIILLGTGLASVAAARRRRKKASAI